MSKKPCLLVLCCKINLWHCTHCPVKLAGVSISVSVHLWHHFYRAMLWIRGTSHGPVSVRHKSEFY